MPKSGRSFGAQARAHLDDLLVPLGFSSGQGESGQVIFCAPTQVLFDHFARALFIAEQFPAVGRACLDLVIEGNSSDGITSVELEGHPLSEVLARAGLVEGAESAAQWPGESITSDLLRIRCLMELLMDPTTGG